MQTWANGTSRYAPPPVAGLEEGGAPEAPDASAEELGAVRIARRVLRTVVVQAALAVPGVVRVARVSRGLADLLGRPLPHAGVGLAVRGNTVAVDLYLITQPDMSMVEVGTAVQEAVGAAVERILGMDAREVNVYIQDVA